MSPLNVRNSCVAPPQLFPFRIFWSELFLSAQKTPVSVILGELFHTLSFTQRYPHAHPELCDRSDSTLTLLPWPPPSLRLTAGPPVPNLCSVTRHPPPSQAPDHALASCPRLPPSSRPSPRQQLHEGRGLFCALVFVAVTDLLS